MRTHTVLLAVALAACSTPEAAGPRPSDPPPGPVDEGEAPPVAWRAWGPDAFDLAQKEQRLILVSVGTTWCHWCHVMDDKTWADPAVRRLIAERFVAIRVDADARPDVAERYEEWAWPATALLTPDAQDVVALKGYQGPVEVAALLRQLVDDQRAGRDLARSRPAPFAPPPPDADLEPIRALVEAQLDGAWDEAQAGWGGPKKYPLRAPLEHALYRAKRRGEDAWIERARRTLESQQRITDPVWGGMFQYSTRGDWEHPHYEKLAFMQGWTLRMYADAARTLGEPAWLETAKATARYVTTFLRSPDGAFYANQDADVGSHDPGGPSMLGAAYYALDDAGRRAVGVPFIDTHVYASHNGELIAGLATLAAVADDEDALRAAEEAAAAILATHRLGDGFRHTADDESGRLYLADQVAMAEGFVALNEATGDLRWRDDAVRTARFLREHLRDADGVFVAHTLSGDEVGVFATPRRPFEEGVRAHRLLFRLALASDLEGVDGWRDDAVAGLRWFGQPRLLQGEGRMVGEYLLALEDVLHEPVHIAVVAPDDQARSPLYRAALRASAPGRIVERLRPGGRFPDLGRPVAFVCGASFCSRPLFAPEALPDVVEEFVRLEPPAPRG